MASIGDGVPGRGPRDALVKFRLKYCNLTKIFLLNIAQVEYLYVFMNFPLVYTLVLPLGPAANRKCSDFSKFAPKARAKNRGFMHFARTNAHVCFKIVNI